MLEFGRELGDFSQRGFLWLIRPPDFLHGFLSMSNVEIQLKRLEVICFLAPRFLLAWRCRNNAFVCSVFVQRTYFLGLS